MKKKILSAALVVALIAIMVSGTLAYFTDNDEVTNTFTIGSVEIEIHENGALVEGDTLPMDDILLPVVGENPEDAADNYGQKQVTVMNTGNNDAYVQVFVALPKELDDAGVIAIMDNYPDTEEYDWETYGIVGTMTDSNGLVCNVYRYDYKYPVPAGKLTKSEAIEYVYLTSTTDLNVHRTEEGDVKAAYLVDEKGNELTSVDVSKGIPVYVYARAVQAEGFSDYFDALDTAFGKTLPWD